jgi:hypothetical protein
MHKQLKTIFGFAVLGFAVTAAFYVLGAYHDFTNPPGPLEIVAGATNVILCPPVLLFAWCIDCEYGTPAGLIVNLVIVGLLNAAVYAAIGMAVARRRERGRNAND